MLEITLFFYIMSKLANEARAASKKTKGGLGMAKAKQGDVLSCKECGLVVVVDEISGYAEAAIVCCKQPMAKGKLAAAKAKKKAVAKAIPASAAKALKAASPVKGKAKAAAPKAATKATAKAPAKAAKPAPKKPVKAAAKKAPKAAKK